MSVGTFAPCLRWWQTFFEDVSFLQGGVVRAGWLSLERAGQEDVQGALYRLHSFVCHVVVLLLLQSNYPSSIFRKRVLRTTIWILEARRSGSRHGARVFANVSGGRLTQSTHSTNVEIQETWMSSD